MPHRGERLQRQREALGLSRAELAAETRIPEAHIAALEEGRLRDLPAGPYAVAWMTTLEARVGLSSPEVTASGQGRGASVPYPWVKGFAGASFLALVALVAWQFSGTVSDVTDAVTAQPDSAQQEVLVRARTNSRLWVQLDDQPRERVNLAGGQEREWVAERRIVLDVEATESLRIHYNGHLVVPQGRQKESRTLVFEDDRAGGHL